MIPPIGRTHHPQRTAGVGRPPGSPGQVRKNRERTQRQPALVQHVATRGGGCPQILLLDDGAGQAGSSLPGRADFPSLLEILVTGQVGLVAARERSSLVHDKQHGLPVAISASGGPFPHDCSKWHVVFTRTFFGSPPASSDSCADSFAGRVRIRLRTCPVSSLPATFEQELLRLAGRRPRIACRTASGPRRSRRSCGTKHPIRSVSTSSRG
jgi:hypothetical protein